MGHLVRMGRHIHVSIVAASQAPNDFFKLEDFAAKATVLLFHRLEVAIAATKVPTGTLWSKARRQTPETFSALVNGQAWYCTESGTGIVQVRKLS